MHEAHAKQQKKKEWGKRPHDKVQVRPVYKELAAI